MKKKTYVVPSVKVVNVEMQGSLLAASSEPRKSATVERGSRRGFEDDWE